MLEALWQWQAAAPERLVLLAGGDVHLGGFTRVSRNDEFAFEQLTVGPGVLGCQMGQSGSASVPGSLLPPNCTKLNTIIL